MYIIFFHSTFVVKKQKSQRKCLGTRVMKTTHHICYHHVGIFLKIITKRFMVANDFLVVILHFFFIISN